MTDLTREQIEQMEAGPEMDRLVAERIGLDCKWEWTAKVDKHVTMFMHPQQKPFSTPDGALADAGDTPNAVAHPHNWSPSTCIEHAIEAAEKIKDCPPPTFFSNGPWLSMDAPWGSSDSWRVGWRGFYDYEGENMSHYAQAGTLELAICRAALLTTLGTEGSQ